MNILFTTTYFDTNFQNIQSDKCTERSFQLLDKFLDSDMGLDRKYQLKKKTRNSFYHIDFEMAAHCIGSIALSEIGTKQLNHILIIITYLPSPVTSPLQFKYKNYFRSMNFHEGISHQSIIYSYFPSPSQPGSIFVCLFCCFCCCYFVRFTGLDVHFAVTPLVTCNFMWVFPENQLVTLLFCELCRTCRSFINPGY